MCKVRQQTLGKSFTGQREVRAYVSGLPWCPLLWPVSDLYHLLHLRQKDGSPPYSARELLSALLLLNLCF